MEFEPPFLLARNPEWVLSVLMEFENHSSQYDLLLVELYSDTHLNHIDGDTRDTHLNQIDGDMTYKWILRHRGISS